VTITQIIHQIATDSQLEAMLAAIVIDLVLGVLAALKIRTFNLAYLANFARNDVLGKVVPWAALDAVAIVASGQDIVIPGFDLTAAAHAAFAIVIAAIVGSILGSLKDLGLSVVPAALGSGR
jgi:hypothetical protein